jgi:uncharacterized membrane protein
MEGETGDRCWKWGVFYVNRNDPALWVKKRYGIGYTLNFGNAWSWAVLGLIIVAIAIPLSVPAAFIYEFRHHLRR